MALKLTLYLSLNKRNSVLMWFHSEHKDWMAHEKSSHLLSPVATSFNDCGLI